MDLRNARVLVTGATSGIGAATAQEFCRAGVGELVVVARREAQLRSLAQAWSREHGTDIAALALDVGRRRDVERAAADNPALFDLDVLVNNAGLAMGTEPMQDARLDDWDAMVDTNVKGLLYLTRLALPGLLDSAKERGVSHIVNLGSVAGRWVYPGGGVYCATKHAVRALSEGLRMDLLGRNVRVTNIEPGMVETEFSLVRHRGDKERAKKVYEGMRALAPQDVAEAIVWCVSRPPHVNVQELVLYPTDQSHVGQVHRGGLAAASGIAAAGTSGDRRPPGNPAMAEPSPSPARKPLQTVLQPSPHGSPAQGTKTSSARGPSRPRGGGKPASTAGPARRKSVGAASRAASSGKPSAANASTKGGRRSPRHPPDRTRRGHA